MCIVDFEGRFLKLNENWSSVLGYTLEELQVASLSDPVEQGDIHANRQQAVDEIRRSQGTQFDPALVAIFLNDVLQMMPAEEG